MILRVVFDTSSHGFFADGNSFRNYSLTTRPFLVNVKELTAAGSYIMQHNC